MIRTIDHFFDYQMANAIKETLKEYEKDISDFQTAGELFDFLYEHSTEFGRVVIDNMSTWMDEEEWMEEAKQ